MGLRVNQWSRPVYVTRSAIHISWIWFVLRGLHADTSGITPGAISDS